MELITHKVTERREQQPSVENLRREDNDPQQYASSTSSWLYKKTHHPCRGTVTTHRDELDFIFEQSMISYHRKKLSREIRLVNFTVEYGYAI